MSISFLEYVARENEAKVVHFPLCKKSGERVGSIMITFEGPKC